MSQYPNMPPGNHGPGPSMQPMQPMQPTPPPTGGTPAWVWPVFAVLGGLIAALLVALLVLPRINTPKAGTTATPDVPAPTTQAPTQAPTATEAPSPTPSEEPSPQPTSEAPSAPQTTQVVAPPPDKPVVPADEVIPGNAAYCAARYGNTGGFTQSAVGTSVTSCAFAEEVRYAYGYQPYRHTTVVVRAASPVTGKSYNLTCSGGQVVRCAGGDNAVIYLR